MYVLRTVVLILFSSVCSRGYLFAQSDSLGGLDAFGVIVEEVPAALEEAGVSRIHLQDRVEGYLMDSGILVSDMEESYLYVYLRGLEIINSDGISLGYSYALHLSVRQMAYLLRNMSVIDYVTTWSDIQLGIAPGTSIDEVIDRALVVSLDAFINDYDETNDE